MNRPFQAWPRALDRLRQAAPGLEIRRLQVGDGAAFTFLEADGLTCQVLGPIPNTVQGQPALRFLHTQAAGCCAPPTP